MQPTTSRTRPTITCDGTGVVSHAGTVLLAELADRIGLTAALGEATSGLRAVTFLQVRTNATMKRRYPTLANVPFCRGPGAPAAGQQRRHGRHRRR